MRMKRRHISREALIEASSHYEIIESYPDDKYLPSYLVYALYEGIVYHIVFAIDINQEYVHVVTAYRPDLSEWTPDLKRRIQS